jgi:hypothetical protein
MGPYSLGSYSVKLNFLDPKQLALAGIDWPDSFSDRIFELLSTLCIAWDKHEQGQS